MASQSKSDRPSLGFGGELDSLDDAGFAPKPKLAPDVARKAAEDAGFRSREAKIEAPKAQRRRRTGRNAQINIKTKPDVIEAFTRIADANGWGLGETFERALDLLQRDHAS